MTNKSHSSNASRTKDFAWVALAYLVAFGVAWVVFTLSAGESTLWRLACADIAATLVIFVFARLFSNSSFYDAYWSVAPPVLIGYWLASRGIDLRSLLLSVLVLLWAVRLTHNWARGWRGLGHQDWRYVDLSAKTGRWYPLVDLLGIQLLPTILVFIGCLPFYIIVNNPSPISWPDALWLLAGSSAIWLEFRADNVLRTHRLDENKIGQVLREDVWGWCRHPNYLGELVFWFALALCAFVTTGLWYSWLGFVCMVGLFLGVSIPMIEKRELISKPGYGQYVDEVPMLLPTRLRPQA
ncbi:MAG: DUF1295 domain-containing protein [Pseudomonadales bacterium]|nr:DUF1295 domain-containing protein [Pseudomonadales bacterium]